MIKAGLIGCGAIGSAIAEAIAGRFAGGIALSAVCDADESKARNLLDKLGLEAPVLTVDELVRKCDLVIEAASGDVSYAIARKALESGKDVMVMSTGGLLHKEDIFPLAEKKKAKVYLPSGALCGLDGIKSAMAAGVSSVRITTRKPPAGLEGAPYVVDHHIDLKKIKKETVIFEGTADEATKGFPKNVNVAATLSLCGPGPENTKVRIITSPDFRSNSHEIEAEGDFGKLSARSDNVPMPGNPKTSYLAALSAVATLKNIICHTITGN